MKRLSPEEQELVASALVAMTSDMPPDVAEAVSGHLASIVAKLQLAETITRLFADAQAAAGEAAKLG